MNRAPWLAAFGSHGGQPPVAGSHGGQPPVAGSRGQNVRPRSISLQPDTREFHDLRSFATPTRWHPEYRFQNESLQNQYPPKSPNGLTVTPFLSTIHEDIPALHNPRHSDTVEPSRGLLGNGFSNASSYPRRHSEGDLLHPDRGRYIKRSQRDGEERKSPRRNTSADIAIISDGSLLGLLAVPSRKKSPLSEGDFGIEADTRRDLSFRSSAKTTRSDISRKKSGVPGLDQSQNPTLSQSRRSKSDTNLSTNSRSSVASSRRPSSVDFLGGSTVSAEMVAENPTLAASTVFASIEIPVDLLGTSSKRLKKIFGSVIMCVLFLTLGASLGAAVYFAVVLNNTQAEHIEFLRATLRLQLEQTSAERLIHLTEAETMQFKQEYCKEIDAFYKRSALASTYQSCEVASVQNGEIRLVLYFGSGNRSTEKETSKDAILEVLASSAPRVGQTENGIVSINNVHVNLTSVAISVEEITQDPQSAQSRENIFGSARTTMPPGKQLAIAVNLAAANTISTAARPSTTGVKTSTDPYSPCSPGKSETYYRYPDSCGIFFQCLNGRSVTMGCGSNLFFDMTKKVCVQNVTDCVQPKDADLGIDPELLHPCETKGGVYHPHPRACNMYIHCDNSKSFVRICPHSLVFDLMTETCVHFSDGVVCTRALSSNRTENTNQTLEQNRIVSSIQAENMDQTFDQNRTVSSIQAENMDHTLGQNRIADMNNIMELNNIGTVEGVPSADLAHSE